MLVVGTIADSELPETKSSIPNIATLLAHLLIFDLVAILLSRAACFTSGYARGTTNSTSKQINPDSGLAPTVEEA